MNRYGVHFIWQDKKHIEIVECEDLKAAVVFIMTPYPGACIGSIWQVN
jgi:hypothetical protein